MDTGNVKIKCLSYINKKDHLCSYNVHPSIQEYNKLMSMVSGVTVKRGQAFLAGMKKKLIVARVIPLFISAIRC